MQVAEYNVAAERSLHDRYVVEQAIFNRIRNSTDDYVAENSFSIPKVGKARCHFLAGSRLRSFIFIFGCQRSGTNNLEKLFRADPRSAVFGQFSSLSIDAGKTVLSPLPELTSNVAGRIVVARFVLASHRSPEIINAVPGSRAVWMFLDYQPVVALMVRKWSGDFEAISRRVETDSAGRWELQSLRQSLNDRAEGLSEHPSGSRGRIWDLYALYWLARNQAYPDRGLEKDPRVILLNYMTLVMRPVETIESLLLTVDEVAPLLSLPIVSVPPSTRRDRQSRFSPRVAELCDAMHDRLRTAEALQA